MAKERDGGKGKTRTELMDITYLRELLHFTIGLLTILNPIAAAAIMVSILPPDISKKEITTISIKTSLTVLIASLLTVFLGNYIFKLFGINIYSIKVIGGIVLFIIALNMVQGKISETKHSTEESEEAKEKEDISIIPLGIPILFGPGVIATLIVFYTRTSTLLDLGLLILSIFISSVTVFYTLKNAVILNRFLGVTGLKIATRIMGLIVGAIASQFIISGAKALWNIY